MLKKKKKKRNTGFEELVKTQNKGCSYSGEEQPRSCSNYSEHTIDNGYYRCEFIINRYGEIH